MSTFLHVTTVFSILPRTFNCRFNCRFPQKLKITTCCCNNVQAPNRRAGVGNETKVSTFTTRIACHRLSIYYNSFGDMALYLYFHILQFVTTFTFMYCTFIDYMTDFWQHLVLDTPSAISKRFQANHSKAVPTGYLWKRDQGWVGAFQSYSLEQYGRSALPNRWCFTPLPDSPPNWSLFQNLHSISGIHHRPFCELQLICQLQPLVHIPDSSFVWNIS